MARIRSVKPEFFQDEELALSASAYARLAFIGLWTQADREGRIKDRPGRLRAQIFPFEPSVDMNTMLNELVAAGSLVRYEIDGEAYLSIPGFAEHQRPHPKEPDSQIPPPPSRQVPVSQVMPCFSGAGTGDFPSSPVGGGREGSVSGSGGGNAPPLPPPPQNQNTIIKAVPLWAIFRGDRLYVPQTWHEKHIGMLGGADANRRLFEWYQIEDAYLMKTQTPVRDWFKWLDARYSSWVPDAPIVNESADRAMAEAEARRASVR